MDARVSQDLPNVVNGLAFDQTKHPPPMEGLEEDEQLWP